MRPIGGELEQQSIAYESYFTDSGRSSLRLFLRSANYRDKKFLLPNFFCEVIEAIFKEEKIAYSFYNVFEDLSIDINSIEARDYDVLYVINYFGNYINLSTLDLDDKILLEDNVFLYDFENFNKAKNWYAFNSYRKISSMSDGSMIKTNLAIDDSLIVNIPAIFSIKKREAKDIKYKYIHNNVFTQDDYLQKFVEAENTLAQQYNIYTMSNHSLSQLSSATEQSIRKARYERICKVLGEHVIKLTPTFYSFAVLSVKNRDVLRKKLRDKDIFLAVHWPESSQGNILYENIISLPLSAIYADIEFEYMLNELKATL